MEFKQLLAEIENYKTEVFSMPALRQDIAGATVLHEPGRELSEHILYMCTAQIFNRTRIRPEQNVSFVIYGDGARRDMKWDAGRHGANIVFLPNVNDPLPALNKLSAPLLEEQRISALLRRLDSALFENKGLQKLLDAAYSVLKNPIFISDMSAKYIASSYNRDSIQPGSPFAEFIESDIANESIDSKGQEYINKHNLTEILSRRSTPYIAYNELLGVQGITAAVRIQNVMVGQIYMLSQEHDFTEGDYRLFAHLVGLVSQEMQKDEFYVRNRREAGSYFLVDILTNRHINPESVRRRLINMKYTVGENLYVMVVQPRNAGRGGTSVEVLSAQTRNILSGMLSAILDGRLVALLNLRKGETPDKLLEGISAHMPREDIIMGLSNEFDSLEDIERGYRQAETAARIGSRFEKDGGAVYYSKIVELAMLEAYGRENDLKELVLPKIERLMRHDSENNTEYAHTLREYLRHGGSVPRTASAMHLHKNTLLYRMNRIKSMLDTTLEDGRELFRYQLSFLALDMGRE